MSGYAQKDLEFGLLVDSKVLKQMEIRIGEELLLQKRPICGREVEFFRKIFGMSRRDFASQIGLSDAGVLSWEKASTKRLLPMSEIAIRVYFAKRLSLPLEVVTTPLFIDKKNDKKTLEKTQPSFW